MTNKGVSQRQMALALHLSQTAVSRRLAGDVDFTVSELVEAAGILDTPIADLLPSSPSADHPALADSADDVSAETEQHLTHAAHSPSSSAANPNAADDDEAGAA